LLGARASSRAFHPHGAQQVLSLNDSVFALLRTSPDGQSRVACLHNVSDRVQPVALQPRKLSLASGIWHDLLTGEPLTEDQGILSLSLGPYAVRWLSLSAYP
jgi:sucrose phosphorylase